MADDTTTDAPVIQDPPPAPMVGVRPPLILRGDPNAPKFVPQPMTQQQQSDLDLAKTQYWARTLPLDQAQKAVAAAIKFQAQRSFQADLAAGKSPGEALTRNAAGLFFEHPQVFAGAVTRNFEPKPAAPSYVPANPQTGEPAHFVTRGGGVNVPRPAAAPKTPANKVMNVDGKLIQVRPDGSAQQIYPPPPAPSKPGFFSKLFGGGVSAPMAAAPSQTPVAPLPRTKGELQKDKVYSTRHGPATWNGSKFIAVAAAAPETALDTEIDDERE